jgi:uncharacterized membrane protein
MYQYGYSDGHIVNYSPLHFIGGAIGWVLVAVFIVWLFRAMRGGSFHDKHHKIGGHGHHGSDPAMTMLRERYVKGEISKEEFETKKKDLME